MKKTLQVILSVLEIVMYTTGILVSAKTLVELAAGRYEFIVK